MHLKVCPNTECGKVSDVSAAVCESCGKPFPNIDLVSTGTTRAAAPVGSQAPGSDPTAVGKDKPHVAAWPLIMMAVVAGGIPLLWANRSQLPTPKTWQVSTPDMAKTIGVAPAPSVPTPPPAAPAPTPAVSASAIPPSPPTQTEPVPSDVKSASQVPTVDTADDASKSQTPQPAQDSPPKKVAKAASPKKIEPPRPCTEALAAMGLCGPKQSAK